MEHAEPLPLFSDLLKEEYLWPEEYDEEEDEMRYEEDEVFPDDLFYSFYYYSWQAVLAYRDILEQVSRRVCRACRRSAETAVKEDTQCLKNSMRCTSPRSRKWSL